MEYSDNETREFNETDRYEEAFAKYNLKVDNNTVEKAINSISKNNAVASDKDYSIILGCIDYTSLRQTDSDEGIMQMCDKINDLFDSHPELPPFASICIYPCYAGIVSKSIEIEDIKTTCVSGGFPSGQTPSEIKIAETAMAIHDGADEIDIVMPAGRFLSGEYEYIADEIQELKEVCGERTMKVILETSLLGSLENVKKASLMAMYSGADFIKTSTGKDGSKATPEAFYTMCTAIKEYAAETGIKVGIKAAGGISTPQDAYLYYSIVRHVLGKEWLNSSLFRIGTSRLAQGLIGKLTGQEICL